jgi:hypothetical protein
MQNLTSYIASDGTKYHIPADKEAEFKADFGEDAQPAVRYRTKDGQGYTIPTSEIENFRVDFPDAEPTRRMSFADGSARDFTMPELSKFLRSPEWREGEQFKADRDERDKIVASRPVPNPKSESTFLADYADGLADAGGTAIGRTLGGSLSRFAKFIGTVTELDPSVMAKDYARRAIKGTLSKDDFTAGAVADRMLNNGGMFIGNQINKATDILFPAEQKTDSAVAQGVGKAIGLGAGLAEFALTPTPILAGGHFVEGWQQTYEAAKARGATDEEAMQLGLMRGGTDAGITTAFKNAPVHRIMKAFGYAPKGAVQALIDKAGKDGIAGVARGDLATAVGKQMLANAIPSIIEMGGLGAAQEFIDSAITQEAQTGKIDWEKCATDALKTGGEQALFGAVMAMLPTPFKVREALKQRDAMLKTALEEPMGVLAYANANPEAANKLAEAWSREGKISRRVAREAGLPEMDEASRNAVGETIVKSQDANAELAKNRIAAEKAEVEKQPTEIKDETGNVTDEKPAQPKPPVETRAEGSEAVRPVEAEPPRGEAPRPDVVKPAEKPKEPPQKPPEASAPPKTGEDTPKPAEGAEPPSRASDAISAPKRTYNSEPLVFKKPIVGKTGAKLVSYVWPNKGEEYVDKSGNDRTRRISDWDFSETNDSTGRKIVHQFAVETPDGQTKIVSAETAAEMLGIPVAKMKGDALKAIRKQIATSSISDAARRKATGIVSDLESGKPLPYGALGADVKGRVSSIRVRPDGSVQIGCVVNDSTHPYLEVIIPQDGKGIKTNLWATKKHIKKNGGIDVSKEDLAVDATTAPAAKVPDGKGKMVKPKAAESDYGVTMFEEPSVDGEGVSYVVKDGPSDAHRMMFKSKAEAEARLAELRAERKAIKESPSATLADGTKIYLRKTNEGWVPYNENYIDLRRGVFNAAKTKAGAIKVAEKGVKWAKDVAEFNSAYKRFEEDFGLDEFNKKVGWGNENGEGWNESAALEHLRQFDLETLEDLKERAKQFNLGHHNGRNEKIQEWFDKVISEKKAPVPDGKGKMKKRKGKKAKAEEQTAPAETPAPEAEVKTAEPAEAQSTYTPAKELVEAKDRIEAMPTDSKSQKDAKKRAQKDWLLSSVDDAIKSHAEAAAPEGAPSTEKFVDDYEALLKRRDATYDRMKLFEIHEQIDKARETFQKGEMITFDVPDNGTFKVYNNPEALTLFKRLVQKRLSPTSLKEGTIVAAEKPLANDIETSGVGKKVAEGEKPAAAPKAEAKPVGSPSAPAKETIGDTIAELDRLIAEEESGVAPSGKAEGLPSRAENFAPGPGAKGFFSRLVSKNFFSRLVSKNSIVRAIKDNFPEFAIRGKNTTNIGKNYNGHFEPWRELIRSKDMSSIDTIPHEIGHGISMIAKRKMMNIPQEVKRELAKWGRDLYGNKRPAAGYMEEGFAEYVRGYMTGAEDLATQAPHLDAWFRNSFAKKNPDFVRRMDRVRAEVMRWRMQNDVQKVAAMQNPETSAARRAWDKVKSVFTQEAWNDEGATLTKGYKKSGLDSLHEWREDFRQLEKLVKSGQGGSQAAKDLAAKINRKILSDPRIFASNARGTSKARVLDMAKYGVTNLTGTEKIGDVTGFDANGKPIRNNNTESYRDIFGDFTKKELADFDVYAAAKVGLENYVKKGREFGMDQATLERVVAKLESPRFLNALERFTAFSRRALSVGLEAGALTPEQYQKIVGEHKYYVRTERRLAEDGAGTGGRQQNPIKAIKGSTRNIVPPRTATLMQIEKQLRYFQTMKTLNMIARDVLQAEKANEAFFKNGTGRDYKIGANLPVKVPNAKESVKFKSEKLRKQVVDALNSAGAQGAGGETGDALFDQLFADGDAPLTVFRERPSDGRHGLVSTYIDGKLVTFELPDAAWEKYITGMEKGNGGFDNKVGDALWNVATATPKLLRLGATTLNPVFATANFMRDTFHAAIMSESGALPLVSSVSGMMNDVLGKDAGRLFRSMGGEMAMLMGANPEAQAKHMSEVALAKGLLGNIEANTTLLSPLSGVSRVIADVLSKPEMGPRVREVMGVMKRAQAAGLDREASAWLAFAAGKDISIDFGKHGYLMKRLNQLVPYTNAWYRGLEQFVRKMGVTNALPTQFEERRSVNLAKTATRALVTLSATAVANSIASLLLMDDKERRAQFNKTPREKWEYDDILGTVRVPLPFELGAVFYAIPKAMVYEAFGDKGAVKEAIWHGLSTNVGKYSSVQDFLSGFTIIAPFVDNLRNAKWDGAPVVAPHIKDAYAKDPQMWYDHSTTEIAKWAGEKLGWAPAHIDHVANTWTGGMWKRFLSPASDTTLSTATGLSTFRPRPTARRDVRDFYEFRSEAQSHYNAGNASLEDIGRLRRANKLHEEIAPLFKEARELGSSGLSQSERNKRREAIMDEVFDKIHEWRVAETNDRKGGIAKAADALTSSVEISDDVRSRNLAALKGISYEEAADALKAYGREKMQTPVRNSRGFKTGRMKTHPRWTNETIQKRLRILRRVMNENSD